MEVVLEISFLIFSDANLWFAEKEFIWKTYTIEGVLSITNKVELIDNKEFAKAAFNKNSKTFVVHVASILEIILIHLVKETQIAFLQAEKAPTKV